MTGPTTEGPGGKGARTVRATTRGRPPRGLEGHGFREGGVLKVVKDKVLYNQKKGLTCNLVVYLNVFFT